MSESLEGIELIRWVADVSKYVRESFNGRFTTAQLLAIYTAMRSSDWDFYPDQWTERQVQEALKGIVPTWDENGKPCFGKRPPTHRTIRAFLRAVDKKLPKHWSHDTIQHCLDTGLVTKAVMQPYPYLLTRDGLIEIGEYEG